MYANVRRDLPGWLRQLRIDRKLSQAQLAKRLNVSKSYVSQIESGKLIPQDDTAKALDLVYGTGDEIQKAAKDAREDRQPWLRSWFDQEQRAVLLRTWEPMLVPGLLQCESYMRAVFRAVPSNAGQIDDLVAKRLERQANTIYRESAPVALSAIIGEVALRRGPRDVLKRAARASHRHWRPAARQNPLDPDGVGGHTRWLVRSVRDREHGRRQASWLHG